jgi:hypothetical protein
MPKCPPGEPVRPVAFRRDGTPLSFMTDRQRAVVAMLTRAATVVPTTARSLDAFRRVDLAFDHAAILGFGGVVLAPGGRLDEEWDAVVRPRVSEVAGELRAVHRAAEAFIARHGLGVRARVVSDFELPLYLVMKHPAGESEKLVPIHDELLAHTEGGRFFVHFNGNNLSLVPGCLGKERAVRHVLGAYFGGEPVATLGVGDSLSDAAFLDLCDFGVLPRRSQLARQRLGGGRRCSAAATDLRT